VYIFLEVSDFDWAKNQTGAIIGSLSQSTHPKFQKTYSPADLILSVTNNQTKRIGEFIWHHSVADKHVFKITQLRTEGNFILTTPLVLITLLHK
jgi:hypothetical protein